MNNYKIEDVLSHREPMILLDALSDYDENTCTCCVKITPKSPFYDKNKEGVPSYIGCEYMAQAIAAYAGAAALDKNNKIKIGFLLGSRKYKTFRPIFKNNNQLKIKVEKLYQEDSGLSVFECEITDEQSHLLAQAKINVFQPNNPEQFLKENYE